MKHQGKKLVGAVAGHTADLLTLAMIFASLYDVGAHAQEQKKQRELDEAAGVVPVPEQDADCGETACEEAAPARAYGYYVDMGEVKVARFDNEAQRDYYNHHLRRMYETPAEAIDAWESDRVQTTREKADFLRGAWKAVA